MDAFDGPRPFKMRSGFGDIAGGLAEGGDDDDFGFAHLEDEQEQADDQNQKDSDAKNEWIPFHG
jgi:hypothetical protein